MLLLVCEIDEFKGAWSAMENHTTSLQLLGEVSSFGRNFKEIAHSWKDQSLDVELLCRLHAVFTGAREISIFKEQSLPLEIKKGDDILGALNTASPAEVRNFMPRLMEWVVVAFEKKEMHPLFVIALFTAIFLQFCPFEKGNQKIARLLIILLMFKEGYSYAPYSTLDTLLQERATDYYKALKHTQTTLAKGKIDWDAWLEFFFELLKAQKDKLKERVERGSAEIVNMPALSTKVLKLFDKHNRLSMKEIERLTRGKRSTLKLRLAELVDGGYIMRHGQARATWYSRV
ncbi:MAG: Fic family protein [Alphaproteobacteria bacterium]|nr:Fic family protein [Alphaproteobacteria bacterium]